MSRIKSLYEDEQERRHQKMVEWVWANEAAENGWLDDDHERVEEYAAELIEDEDRKAEQPSPRSYTFWEIANMGSSL